MNNKARIAVIGTGWWATEAHIPALIANPNAELVALCDTDPERVQTAATHFQIEQTYTDVPTLLSSETLDGAVIVTNHTSHYKVAHLCLEQGLHLVIEKPLTLYAPDAQQLVAFAQHQRREIIVGYPYNYLPFAVQVRKLLAAGQLGEIQFANAMFNSNILGLLQGNDGFMAANIHGPGDAYADPLRSLGGHGHTQLTHIAGLLFFLTQLKPRRVQAFMQNFGLTMELAAVINVAFTNGAVGTVNGIGSLGGTNHADQDIHIYCTEGIVKLSARDCTCTLYRPHQEPENLSVPGGHTYLSAAPSQNLVGICLGQDENRSPVEAGWRTVEVLHGAYQSAASNGQPIEIEELYQ